MKIIYSRKSVLGMIDQCHSETDLVKYMCVSDLYSWSIDFPLYDCIDFKIFFIIKKMVPAGGIHDLGTCSSIY